MISDLHIRCDYDETLQILLKTYIKSFFNSIIMVKNTKGGKNSKKIARKHITEVSTKPMRYALEEGELYGTVVKHFGGQCQVMTTDGELRLCIVRGKFKGRQRRDNNICLGSWVLVGLRDWEMRSDGKTKCDLLYVYNDIEKENLKQNTRVNFSELNKANSETSGIVINDDVEFRDDTEKNAYLNELQEENIIIENNIAENMVVSNTNDNSDVYHDSEDEYDETGYKKSTEHNIVEHNTTSKDYEFDIDEI